MGCDQLGNFPFTNSVSLISDSMILDLCADDYDIYVTDDNDCIGTVLWGGVWQFTIDSGIVVTIDPPNVTQATCFNSNDGQVNVIFPINTDFTYTWETLGGVIVDTGAYTTILGGGDYNLVAIILIVLVLDRFILVVMRVLRLIFFISLRFYQMR